MTGRIHISHLSFVGAGKVPATVEFGPRTNIIRGPSDTGKSFIVDAIDYMLGGSELREIPQRAGYTTVLMGVVLPNGSPITLSRAVAGGAFLAHQGELRDLPPQLSKSADVNLEDGSGAVVKDDLERAEVDRDPLDKVENADKWPKPLAARHDNRSTANVSRFLLDRIGLASRQLRRNSNNKKSALTIRDVARLCVIDETRMQDATPPGQTGNFTERTKEVSALKVFLQNEDDSALVEVPSPKERRQFGEAQAQVLDRLLDDLRPKIAKVPSQQELQSQLSRLTDSIAATTGSIESAVHARAHMARLLGESQQELREWRERLSEARALEARFDLLRAQYESDLQRLEMVSEAGSLIGLFDPGTCVFCGAEPEHQQHHIEGDENTTNLGAVVSAESTKTAVLLEDLLSTTSDLRSQIQVALSRNTELAEVVRIRSEQLTATDSDMSPLQGELNELVGQRAQVVEHISVHDRIEELEAMQQQIVRDAKTEKAVAVDALNLSSINEFSERLRVRLKAWGYPGAELVRYDRNELDIVDGDQMRSAHGKGVRAVLHAAFTIALADHCFARGTPHPGFVVVDSPLVTYRPPRPGDESLVEDRQTLGAGFTGRFYEDLEQNFDGQILIMENTDPPLPVPEGTVDIEFTKVSVGRYGLFPSVDVDEDSG